jgi:hypothetical protein
MATNDLPAELLYKTVRAQKTVCFDFSKEGPVLEGNGLTDPVLSLPPGTGLVVVPGSLVIITADFIDGAGGDPVPAGQGAKVTFGPGGTPGVYRLSCMVTSTGPTADIMEMAGRLQVCTSPGNPVAARSKKSS